MPFDSQALSPGLRQVLARVHSTLPDAYLVGGAVRDLLRGVEPIDLDLLMRLGGIRAERVWVSGALDRLLQFLDMQDCRYRLYHATLAEFLTADKTRDTADLETKALMVAIDKELAAP